MDAISKTNYFSFLILLSPSPFFYDVADGTNDFCSDLQNDFRTGPQPVQGIAGDSVVLECEPPRGHPEPQIRWKKNGQSLELDLDLGVDSDRYKTQLFSYLWIHVFKVCNLNLCLFLSLLRSRWNSASNQQDPGGGDR